MNQLRARISEVKAGASRPNLPRPPRSRKPESRQHEWNDGFASIVN